MRSFQLYGSYGEDEFPSEGTATINLCSVFVDYVQISFKSLCMSIRECHVHLGWNKLACLEDANGFKLNPAKRKCVLF